MEVEGGTFLFCLLCFTRHKNEVHRFVENGHESFCLMRIVALLYCLWIHGSYGLRWSSRNVQPASNAGWQTKIVLRTCSSGSWSVHYSTILRIKSDSMRDEDPCSGCAEQALSIMDHTMKVPAFLDLVSKYKSEFQRFNLMKQFLEGNLYASDLSMHGIN
jgi:hypothetical protein